MADLTALAAQRTVADAIGTALVQAGVRTVFGLVGSGNFHVTNALTAAGATLIPARHEGGAVTAADAYARVSGGPGVVTVHQGPGLTNAMTGIAEAAKSRTPLLVLAPETTNPRSNFHIDQRALARGVGAAHVRVRSAATVAADLATAWDRAVGQRRTVVLGLPLEVQNEAEAEDPFGIIENPGPQPAAPDPDTVAALADALSAAARPVFVAGRGARRGAGDLNRLSERINALVATSAVCHGLFKGNVFNLGVSGGFATPVAAELITGADLVVAWGCALNMWTTRHGTLLGPEATVVQVDDDVDALGAHRPADLGVVGDVAATARAVLAELDARGFPSPTFPRCGSGSTAPVRRRCWWTPRSRAVARPGG